MIRDGILKTKRYELLDCETNHARKLRELFFATVSLVGGVPPYSTTGGSDRNTLPQLSEQDFLAANDISKSRYFDLKSLAQVGGGIATLLQPILSTPPEATTSSSPAHDVRRTITPQPVETAVTDGPSPQPTTSHDEDGSTATQRSSRSTQAGTPATRETVYGNEEHAVEDAAITPVEQAKGHPEKRDGDSAVPQIEEAKVPPSDSIDSEPSLKAASGGQPISPPLHGGQHGGSNLKPGPGLARPTHPTSPVTPITPDAQLQLEAGQASRLSTESSDGQTVQDVYQKPASDLKPPTDSAPDAGFNNIKIEPQNAGDNSGESKLAARRRGLSPDPHQSALRREDSKDLFLSQRPPMHIDTTVRYSATLDEAVDESQAVDGSRTNDERHGVNGSQMPPSETRTPSKPAQTATQTSSPGRMTTRVSSGVLRHKSVSEILGETPRSAIMSQADKMAVDRSRPASFSNDQDTQSPRYAAHLASSPTSATFRPRAQGPGDREKARSSLSTVVFTRPLAGARDKSKGALAAKERAAETNKDYLVTLFTAQASAQVPTLDHLIKSAHKTLSTQDHFVDYREAQDCRLLKRIYHLQNSNRWSLRQFERSTEPDRPASHWDNLIQEAKWMRADFREEKAYRHMVAKNLADWCAAWVACPVNQRAALQVRVRQPRSVSQVPDNHITPMSLQVDTGCAISDTPPELVSSADDDPSEAADEELPRIDISHSAAPATLFSLAPSDVVFELEKTPASDRILGELPLYHPFDLTQGLKRSHSQLMDQEWKQPIAPVSKFATGRLVLPDRTPPRKRSRYHYAQEDDGSGNELMGATAFPPLPPEQTDVALFNPENKHIIERLHAAHAFRPPSEFPMPSQSFFESRQSSQWTLAEDDELRRLVREYEYNWSLISSCLSSRSQFSSGAERRTPWECFERWVSFEGLPGDMARHQYFRAWNSRRDGARQHLEQLFTVQQQAAGGQINMRRRSSEPVGVERRRTNRYLAAIHAMSKVAKKRETALQKQQHVMRKGAEPPHPRQRLQTPREMSAHRQKIDREREEMYMQQYIASKRVAAAQKAVLQATHSQAAVSSMSASRNGRPTSMHGASPHLSSLPQNAIPSGQRPPGSSQPIGGGMLPNGAQVPGGPMGVRGQPAISQAQMQAYLQAQQAHLPSQGGQDNARVIMEASRLSEQQRMMAQQRQYQTVNGMVMPMANVGIPVQPTAAMMANGQPANGKLSPAAAPATSLPRPSSSPRASNSTHSGQLSNGATPLLNQIRNHLRALHPQANAAEIQQMATTTLAQSLSARTAAANGMSMNTNVQLSPQQHQATLAYSANVINQQMYAHYVRSQQASQQGRLGEGDRSSARPESRGATPQTKSGSVLSGSSQSPRMPQAQISGSS